MEPVNLGNKTLSNKEWGIAVYWPTETHRYVKTWWGRHRHERTGKIEYVHSHNCWYKAKRSQLQGLEDLIKKYKKLKFIPFRNNFKQMPEDRIRID